MKHYSGEEHANAGSGTDPSIRTPALGIAEVLGFAEELTFDGTKPDGAPRKLMSADVCAPWAGPSECLGGGSRVDLCRAPGEHPAVQAA